MIRKFTNFHIETNLEKPVTVDNFFKYDIFIYDKEGRYCERISKHCLSFDITQDIICGNESVVIDAIKTVINNRLWHIERLKAVISGASTENI